MSDLPLPWFTNFGWILAIFVASLACFHLVFIYAHTLGSVAWKRVDYVWLSMALLGMLGAVGSGRELVARNLLDGARARLESSWRFMEMDIEFGTSVAVCREFIRSPFSPPPQELEQLQRGFNEQCEWFKRAATALRGLKKEEWPLIDFKRLFGLVPDGGERHVSTSFTRAVESYNDSVREMRTLEAEAKSTGLELVVRLLGPALVAMALALRMTKVTAEIRAERKKKLES